MYSDVIAFCLVAQVLRRYFDQGCALAPKHRQHKCGTFDGLLSLLIVTVVAQREIHCFRSERDRFIETSLLRFGYLVFHRGGGAGFFFVRPFITPVDRVAGILSLSPLLTAKLCIFFCQHRSGTYGGFWR